ncbi:SEC-C metal-binding domain-containing protein [Streptococcus suis]
MLLNGNHSVARPGSKARFPDGSKVGRNDSCPCGSGKKFKKCCSESGGPRPEIDARD